MQSPTKKARFRRKPSLIRLITEAVALMETGDYEKAKDKLLAGGIVTKGFSEYRIGELESQFKFDYTSVPEFNMPVTDQPYDDSVHEKILGSLQERSVVLGPVSRGSEAMRREFISAVLIGCAFASKVSASCINNMSVFYMLQVKVRPERQAVSERIVAAAYPNGPIDYVLEYNQTSLAVREAKKSDFTQGFVQAVLQVDALRAKSPTLRWAIVSDGEQWQFIKLLSITDTSMDVCISKKASLVDMDMHSVRQLCSQIKYLIDLEKSNVTSEVIPLLTEREEEEEEEITDSLPE
eukprot:TRINITY_DN4752_c0_g1_i1.p1 TRINITY_DN4752_c0_g1~~TRINITY_DN4752_c0_g1_i1.p1  ORF type:complete len:311 (-),score=-40.12 TRINITY_DN4752_c0_g1_i1:180-1061(-)